MFREVYEKYISKYYIIFIVIGVIILLSSLAFIAIYNYESNEEEEKIVNIDGSIDTDVEDNVEQYYYVDVKGAVVKPNVYKVVENTRIIDVIKLAGGLTKKADTSVLNLSKKVSDEMVIIIYTKDEINAFKAKNKTKEEIIKYIEKDCICPDPKINGACSNSDNDEKGENTSKVSLNHATKEELMTLPGIGESKANDIIDYRNSNNLFKSIEELKSVSGIGENTFNQIKDLITL